MTDLTIWKFTVPPVDTSRISMPDGARVLSVHVQQGDILLWAEVDPDAATSLRRFRLIGTGHVLPADERRRFIGTILIRGVSLVFHLFELLGEESMPIGSPHDTALVLARRLDRG